MWIVLVEYQDESFAYGPFTDFEIAQEFNDRYHNNESVFRLLIMKLEKPN